MIHIAPSTTVATEEEVGELGRRVCFVSMEAYHHLFPGEIDLAGGAGFQVVQLARALRRLGHPVAIVAGDYGQGFYRERNGIQVYRANRVGYDRAIVRNLENLQRLFRAMRAARSGNFVLRSAPFLSFFVMLYAHLLKAQFTFMVATDTHCHANGPEDLPPLFRWLFRLSLERADRIMVQTLQQKELMLRNRGLESVLVPNGITVPPFQGPPTHVPYDFLWVGTIKPVKRVDRLLDVARLLAHRRFLVVGGADANAEFREKTIHKLDVAANVDYEGFVSPDKIEEYYRKARFLINTSDWEGFPNTFLHAWSMGVPTVSLGVDPDGIIATRRLGVVAKDPAGLAATTDLLLDDPLQYAEMSSRCHKHVRGKHSIESVAQIFLSALPRRG